MYPKYDLTSQFNGEYLYDPPNPNKGYKSYCIIESKGWTLLMKWVVQTKKYPQLNDKIKHLIRSNKNIINVQNENGWSALILASRHSNTFSTEKTVKILIDGGANAEFCTCYGKSALVFASMYSNIYSTEKTVKLLIDGGANVNLRMPHGGNMPEQWKTALMHAVQNCSTTSTEKTVEMLINAGANVNITSYCGHTAIKLALEWSFNKYKVVDMIINGRIKLNDRGYKYIINFVINNSTWLPYKTLEILNNYLINKKYFNFGKKKQDRKN